MRKLSYYLVSACLVGIKSRYDGTDALNLELVSLLKDKSLLLVCPEKLGGLPTPRPPAWIVGIDHHTSSAGRRRCDFVTSRKTPSQCNGRAVLKNKARVLTGKGKDFSRYFLKGAQLIKDLIRPLKIKRAYLKSRSSSCGYGRVYYQDPTTGKTSLVKGNGILAAVLKRQGIKITSI